MKTICNGNKVEIAAGETKSFSLVLCPKKDKEKINALAQALRITNFLQSEEGKNYHVVNDKIRFIP